MSGRHSLVATIYDRFVRRAYDCKLATDVCRVAVTQEANGFAIWLAFTHIEDTPDDRSYDWHFSAIYETREEAIERAVARVNEEGARS